MSGSTRVVLIDLRIPLAIHGLVHNFCFFWDNCLIGACLFGIDLIRSVILLALNLSNNNL